MASDWPEVTLGEVITLQRGFDLPSQDRKPGNVPVVSSSGITAYHSEVGVKGPGVVTGRYGTIGEVFFINEDYWPLNTTLWVKDFHGNDPHFSSYLLRTIDFGSCSDKSSVPGVNRNDLHRIPVLLPPLTEQRAIAGVLGALDNKIEVNRRLNATLEALARALFQSWFVDFDPVRSKLDGQQPVGISQDTAQLFPSEFDVLDGRRLPRGWYTSALGDHVELIRGTTYKSALKDQPGPYLLGLGSIQRNGGFRPDSLRTYGGHSPDKLLLYPGDLFVSLKDVTQSADLLGAVARVPQSVSVGRLTQDTVRLVPTGSGLSLSYLYRSLLLPEYRDYCRARATGTTNLGLSREDFLNYTIAVPSEQIQRAFEEVEAPVMALISKNNAQAQTIGELRDALLPKLLSGELPVGRVERHV